MTPWEAFARVDADLRLLSRGYNRKALPGNARERNLESNMFFGINMVIIRLDLD